MVETISKTDYQVWEDRLYQIYIKEDFCSIMDFYDFINHAKATRRFDKQIGFSLEDIKRND